MNTKSFFRIRKESLMDKRAVSPVIGEILMVAIVVIIAAVIAAFVFGVTPTTEKTPNVQLEVTGSDATNTLTLKHIGGDPVNLSQCIVYVGGDTDHPVTMSPGLITVGKESAGIVGGGLTEGSVVKVDVIHVDSQSYILDTLVMVGP